MSIKIPQYQEQINPSHQGDAYYNASNVPDAFSESLFRAQGKLAESAETFFNGMSELYNSIQDGRVLEFSNYIDELDRSMLSDPEKGYYAKLGKDAMRRDDDPMSGSIGVLADIDNQIKQKQKELGLTFGRGLKMAELVKTKKMNTMYKSASAHELAQSKAYGAAMSENAVNEALLKGIRYRNVPETRETALNNGRAAILNNAKFQKWDAQTAKLKLAEYESNFHSSIIQQYLKDGDLSASEYFNQHKDKILPDEQIKLSGMVKNNELKYLSKSIASDLFTLHPEDEAAAIAELDKKNLKEDEYDAALQNLSALYSRKRRLKNQEQADAKSSFYDNAVQKLQSGGIVTLDDIPENLGGKDYIEARKAIDSLNKLGRIETDEEIKTALEYMSNYDAQRFKNLDLRQYRLTLSDDDYKTLEKRQQEIQKGGFYTILNKDSVKKYIEQVTGLDGEKQEIFSQYQNMIRSLEEREGRKITDIEKEQFLKYLGTDNKIYKSIEKQIKNGNEFYSALANNIADYQAHHAGEMPPSDMVQGWIKQQAVQYADTKYQKLYEYSVKKIKPKMNEQITLTQFADEFVPALSEKLGAELKVTDRFRPSNGRYASKHSEGRACDISYKTQDGKILSRRQKETLWEETLKNPAVEKIAVSSADNDGKALIKQFGKKYKDKIQDMNTPDNNGKSRDENLGTNHTNHIHVTLYKDNTFKGTDITAVKNQLKQRGFSDEKISQYLQEKGLI